MKYLHNSLIGSILIISLFVAYAVPNRAQDNQPATTEFPGIMQPYEWRFSLGYSSIKMPTDVYLEAAAARFPLFKFAAVMGLPENFLLDGKVNTEFVTNEFNLGARWVYKFNDQLHADVGYSIAYLYGQLKQFAYDSKISGWTSYPSIAVGYNWGSLALTLRGTLSLINSMQSTSGTTTVDFAMERLNGFYYRVTLEQRFYKNTTVGIGFQVNYMRFYYPEWLMFPTFDRYYWIPEFQVMFSI
jgi:hypothetical protein